jgi:hypothetical protein
LLEGAAQVKPIYDPLAVAFLLERLRKEPRPKRMKKIHEKARKIIGNK